MGDITLTAGNLANVYLFYGEESFKKRLYKENLRRIISNNNEMNYSYYEGKGIDLDAVYDSVVTLPFFSEKRLVIVENCEKFQQKKKDAGGIAEDDTASDAMLEKILVDLPSTTVLAFFENNISKNKKLCKWIASKGIICECAADSRNQLVVWLGKGISKAGKKIKKSTVELMVDRVGTDYDRLRLEFEKLINYVGNNEFITDEDVLAITYEEIDAKIFDLMGAMGNKNIKLVLEKYYDMLQTQIYPLIILATMRNQFRLLIQTAELRNKGLSTNKVAKSLGKPEFVIRNAEKYLHNSFKMKEVREILDEINDTDKKIKTGDLDARLGVEVVLVKFSIPKEKRVIL